MGGTGLRPSNQVLAATFEIKCWSFLSSPSTYVARLADILIFVMGGQVLLWHLDTEGAEALALESAKQANQLWAATLTTP